MRSLRKANYLTKLQPPNNLLTGGKWFLGLLQKKGQFVGNHARIVGTKQRVQPIEEITHLAHQRTPVEKQITHDRHCSTNKFLGSVIACTVERIYIGR